MLRRQRIRLAVSLETSPIFAEDVETLSSTSSTTAVLPECTLSVQILTTARSLAQCAHAGVLTTAAISSELAKLRVTLQKGAMQFILSCSTRLVSSVVFG